MLTASKGTVSLRTVAVSKQTLGDGVADRLREEIISGSLPPGSTVAEIPTAERLGVSRVPVREAMLVLERDGLLVFEERGRCRVRRLTARDFEEIYEVRLLLECECFRLAALRRTPEQLAAMQSNIDRMSKARSVARVTLLDIEFHDLIVQAAHHARVEHLWAIMRGQIQLFTASLQRQVNTITENVRETSVAAHRDCLDAIASQDAQRAVEVARKHLYAWREWLDRNQPEDVE